MPRSDRIVPVEHDEAIPDDCFLLASSQGCLACSRFKEALDLLTQPDDFPLPVYVLTYSETTLSKGIIRYGISELPVFLQYAGGDEVNRWHGFFSGPIAEAAGLLRDTMHKAVAGLPA